MTLTGSDWLALLPLLVVAATSVVAMLALAFAGRRAAAVLALVGLAVALVTLWPAHATVARQVTPLLVIDDFALVYMGLVFAASLVVALLAWEYLANRDTRHGAFYVLLLLATLGAAVLVASAHFAALFLGLELLSVSLYTLIAYTVTDARPLEAGLKYLVLAGVSSAFLLFGIALVYAERGTLAFGTAAVPPPATAAAPHLPALLIGIAMILTGIGFKLAVVPFHMWTPDVYEGAPAPVAAFVATVSKGAMVGLLVRFGTAADLWGLGSVRIALVVIAIASILVGNVLALLQRNVKRILAYSSIAHLGYVLVAFLAAGVLARAAVTFYLVAYFVTMLGAFGVVTVLSTPMRDADTLEEYRGLAWQRPAAGAVFTAMLLSLAGIPLTAGFVGKFIVLTAGVGSALWLLALVLVAGSAVGLFYYLRVVVVLYAEPGPGIAPVVPFAGGVVLVLLTLVLVWLGVYPAPLVHLIENAVRSLA